MRDAANGWRAAGVTKVASSASYPADGLDYKTRRYIDDLRQRNGLLESAMRELKQQVLTATEARPFELATTIGSGPLDDASMAVQQVLPTQIPLPAKEALRQLLEDLPRRVPGVESFKGKAIRLRTGEWLVPPDQFAPLKTLLT